LGKLIRRKRTTVHALLKDGDKFLLVQEATGSVGGLWGPPGGGVKRGESVERAAEREAEEEVGYDIELIKRLGVYEDKERLSIRHVFSARIISGELRYQEGELMDAKWFTLGQIEEMKDELRGEWVWDAIIEK